MHACGTELLKSKHESLKFIMNDTGIVFFPSSRQHRDIKTQGLSYEDDYRGNAVAGIITPERVEIRFHSAFSDERTRGMWSRVLMLPDVSEAGLQQLYYQGRKIT